MCLAFMFIAVSISPTITANAKTESILDAQGTLITGDSNMGYVNTTEVDSNEKVGDLPWAASSERTAVMLYLLDNHGHSTAKTLILCNEEFKDIYNEVVKGLSIEFDDQGDPIGTGAGNDKVIVELQRAIGNIFIPLTNAVIEEVPPGIDMRPITFNDGDNKWYSNASTVKSYLESETLIDGELYPRWFDYACKLMETDADAMRKILFDFHYTICIEPISINYQYGSESDGMYTEDTIDSNGIPHKANTPIPFTISSSSKGEFTPIYFATAKRMANINYSIYHLDKGSQYAYKFQFMALPWSLCLDKDVKMGGIACKADAAKDGRRLTNTEIRLTMKNGLAFATIDISAIRPPLHTYDGKSSPGNTEIPSAENYTDGENTIYKLYYTEKVDASGNITEAVTDIRTFTRDKASSYISIDEEDGDYTIEGWKTSQHTSAISTVDAYKSISAIQTGTSAEIIELDPLKEPSLYILSTQQTLTPVGVYFFAIK